MCDLYTIAGVTPDGGRLGVVLCLKQLQLERRQGGGEMQARLPHTVT